MNDQSIAQDPNELFDVVTPDGKPTDIVKQRQDVHRDGDWHRAVHVWVCGSDERGPFLTFQRRSLAKDTSPGRFDATVGGHYRAGEGLEQALRETEEEIGVVVGLDRLRYAGMRICISDGQPGIRDRELQDIFLLRDDRPLTAYRPHPAELAALVRFELEQLLDLLAGDRDRITGRSFAAGGSTIEEIEITSNDLPMRADRYFYRVAIAVDRFLSGERHIAV